VLVIVSNVNGKDLIKLFRSKITPLKKQFD